MDDPRVDALFAACEALSMPVTIHIGDLGGDYGLVDSIGLPRLERALRKFPKLIILGHSQKFWSEIGSDVTEENRGGNPKGPVQPGGRIPELMRKYPNLCGDLSAGSGCNAIMRDPEFGYAFLEEFQDRLFYGTDICSPNDITHIRVKMGPFLEEGVASGKLSLQACEKICWRNAQRLVEGKWHDG
jgi:predicted TIM-barrel fold metal-dependent hydrolase